MPHMQTPEFVFRSMEDAPIQPNDRVAFGALEWGDGGAPGNRAPPNLDIYQSASSGADRYERVDTVSIATDVMDPVGRLFDGDLSHHGGQVDISTKVLDFQRFTKVPGRGKRHRSIRKDSWNTHPRWFWL